MALAHCAPWQSHSSCLLFLCTLLLCWGLHHGCYTCLASTEELRDLCQYLQDTNKMEDLEKCKEALNRGFQPLDNATIPYGQLSKIKAYLQTFPKEVRRIDVLLDLQSWQLLLARKMAEYVRGVQAIASHHQLAACMPPCGLQKEARTYSCRQCVEEDCDIPVACERRCHWTVRRRNSNLEDGGVTYTYANDVKGMSRPLVRSWINVTRSFAYSMQKNDGSTSSVQFEDIHVEEDERTEMSCNVTFILPKTYTVLWKFARKFRVMNLSFFKFKQQLDNDLDYVISPTQPRHRGTYFCEIQDYDGDTLVEKFFFVNVSRKDQYQSRYLKRLFKQIISQTGTNQSAWGQETEEGEDYGFDIPGFLFSQKPLSAKSLIFVTVTVSVFVFLVTLACIACAC